MVAHQIPSAEAPLTANALWRKCPPLRQQADLIRDDFAGDAEAFQRARNASYKAERAAFADGWQISGAGGGLDANPHLSGPSRCAWAWASGWEAARAWRVLAGPEINWLQEGQRVRIVRHDVLSGSLAGRSGVIARIFRDSLLGWILVRVPPQGRQRREREAHFRVGTGELEPIDE